MDFRPYADDESALQLGETTIENHPERLSFTSGFDLTADRRGLEHARVLHAVLQAAIAHLEGLERAGRLSDEIGDPPPAFDSVDNPFR